jgi:hypothetical protein
MKRMWLSVAIAVMAVQGWAAPFSGKQVSTAATWVVHADLEQLRQTQMGTFLVTQMGQGQAADKIAAFSAVFGFDPRKDLKTITLYGKSKDQAQSVVLAGGTFNETQLVTLLKANDSYQTYTFGSHVLHSWIDDKKPAEGRQYGAFHPLGLVAISHGRDMLQEALSVLDGSQPSLDIAKAFGTGVPTQAPFFMAGANVAGMGDANPNAAMLKQADAGQLAFDEKGSNLVINVIVATKDAQAASNMQAAAQGMIAIAQLGQERNPGMAELAQAAHVTMEGKTVHLDVTYPVVKALAMIEQGMARKAEQAARQGGPQVQ